MRGNRITVCIVTFALLLMLLPLHIAQCQNYCQYNVEIRSDGSALWTITQFSSADAAAESWEGFQQKAFDLVDSAMSSTHRGMEVDEKSLQINSTLSAESKITEYSFVWRNFSYTQDGDVVCGDVFGVEGFFSKLFGDAALQLSYSADFSVKSVYPPPYQRGDYALKWARTQDLAGARTQLVFAKSGADSNGSILEQQNGLITAAALSIGVSLPLLGFYAYRKRRGSGKTAASTAPEASPIETDEDKILKLLKASGGTMRQSDITEKCGFSKAKTSQLLTELERRGFLARYKKGRDKIVTLNGVKGE